MAAMGDHHLSVMDNVISNLVGNGARGRTVGVLARDAGDVAVSRSSIVDIGDGDLGNSAAGIVIEHTNAADVRANTLHEFAAARPSSSEMGLGMALGTRLALN